MNNKFLTLVVIGTLVSVGSYYGLNLYAPYQKEQLVAPVTVTVDEVFAGELQEPQAVETPPAEVPAESAEAAPAEAAPAEIADGEAAVETPVAEAAAVEPEPAEVAMAEPAAAEPPPPPAPAPKPAPVSKPAAEPAKPAPAPKAWWGKEDPSQLSIVAATSMSASKAIALMFNGSFDSAVSADTHIKVLTAKGAAVAGQWSVSPKNKRMLTFPVKGPGSYTVVVKAGLEDKAGRKFTQEKSGPVQVQ